MRNEKLKDRFKSNGFLLVLVVAIMAMGTVICSYFMRVHTTVMYSSNLKSLKPGYIADGNLYVKSTVDIEDFEATAERKRACLDSVLPVFTYGAKVSVDVVRNYQNYRASSSLGNNTLLVSYEIILDVLQKGYFRNDRIEALLNEGYTQILVSNSFSSENQSNTVRNIDELLRQDTIDVYLDDIINREYSDILTSEQAQTVKLIVKSCLSPNVFYDELLTDQYMENALEKVEPAIIRLNRGQLLIEKDTVITREQIRIIELMCMQQRVSLYDLLGDFALCFLCYGFAMTVFGRLNEANLHYSTYLISVMVIMLISDIYSYLALTVAGTLTSADFLDAYLPTLLVPLIVAILTNKKKLGFCGVFLSSVHFAMLPQSTVYTFFFSVMAGSCCLFTLRFFTKRIDGLRHWLYSVVLCMGILVLFVFISTVSFSSLPVEMLGVLIQVTITWLIITIILPVIEKLLNLPTAQTLYELTGTDNVLLEKLRHEAPGTYNHSCQVAELAFSAAKAIGANEMLARVGGLYHDIGKIEKPEYFIENQGSEENKHDSISSSLSVSVIKRHVTNGAEMAREANLPDEVVDIIANHHGNDVISYFYNEAKKEKGDKEEVQKQDYSYNNSKVPSSRECAIVMIADSVEAAARTVTNPSTAKFQKLIDSIVLTKIEHGQLVDSGLTFGELETVKNSILETLTAQHHGRVEYPTEEKK